MDTSIWKDNFYIGVDPIDRQHKQLIGQLEKLQAALEIPDAAARKSACENAVAFTRYYTVVHFTTEEHYQREIDFADRVRHKQLHDDFTARVEALADNLSASGYADGDVRAFATLLEDWLVYHITSEDKRMAPTATRHAGL